MMKNFSSSLSILLAVVAFMAYSANAQAANRFSDPFVEYTFDVSDPRWKMTVKPTETNHSVEYVFGDRNDGHLVVRKTTASQDAPMGDIIRDEEAKLQFVKGYVAGKEERFAGKLNGSIFNYEFVERGRPKSGRIYFLRNGTTIYVLKFTGFVDKLRSIQHLTDSIARTFEVKQG